MYTTNFPAPRYICTHHPAPRTYKYGKEQAIGAEVYHAPHFAKERCLQLRETGRKAKVYERGIKVDGHRLEVWIVMYWEME